MTLRPETISNKRTVIAFTKEQGMPDGMTIDTDGNLWVAMWGGWSILCCNPYTGEIIDRINIPLSNVTSCTFGGRDMSTLYITTARAELKRKRKKRAAACGRNICCRYESERNRVVSVWKNKRRKLRKE